MPLLCRTRPLLLFCLLPFGPAVWAQSAKPCVATYLSKPRAIARHMAVYKPIYDPQRGEVFASVGAGSGTKEIIYSMLADSLTVYLQDSDPGCLTVELIDASVKQLYTTAKRTNTARFIPVIGTETETRLPKKSIDKLLIENSLHEFLYPDQLLADVRSSLKPVGMLYIMEQFTNQPGTLHNGCKKPLFTHKTLIDLLSKNGFRFVRMMATYPNEPEAKVCVFTLTN